MAIEAAPSRWRRFWRRSARAAHLTPEQRSASARKAVRARWARAGKPVRAEKRPPNGVADTSDHALAALLTRLRVATILLKFGSCRKNRASDLSQTIREWLKSAGLLRQGS